MSFRKINQKMIQSYEMDLHRYYPPDRMLRMLSNEIYVALKANGYPFPALQQKLGATWMTGTSDAHFFRDVQVEGYDAWVELFAAPLRRTKAVFMTEVIAAMGGEPVAKLSVAVMAVSVQQRKVIPTQTVAETLGAPEVELMEGVPPRITLPEEMEPSFSLPIRRFDCDRNGHVRAHRYVDFVCEAAGYWAQGHHVSPERLRMEYNAECLPGDQLTMFTCPTEEGIYVKGVKQDGATSFKSCLKWRES